MSIESELESFLQNTSPSEDSGIGSLSLDTTGGEGGIPSLTVQGNEGLSGILPGTEALIEARKKKLAGQAPPREQVERDVVSTQSGFDKNTGLPTLTARAEKKTVDKPESLVERALGTKGGIAVFGVLESMGIPTRALAATVREVNPFASAEDKGKTWDEVFADPDSGIFKEARKIVRASDSHAATKFLLEMGISVFEDPLTIVGSLLGGAKSIAKKSAQSKLSATGTPPKSEIAEQFIKSKSGVEDVIKPSSKTQQMFTPAQKEFLETGTVGVRPAQKERLAKLKAPEVVKELDEGRISNITNNITNIREKNGLTDIDGESLFTKVEGSVDDAVNRYKKEVNELYEGVNVKADKSIIGEETQKVVRDDFTKLGIITKELSPQQKTAMAERMWQEAAAKGELDFKTIGGKVVPYNTRTGQLILANLMKANNLGPSDLGISPSAFSLLKRVNKSLERNDLPLKVLRKNKTAVQSAIQVARRADDPGSVAVLEQARNALKKATSTQITDVLKDPVLTKNWLLADDFITQNASGVKAAGNLMYDKAGNPRSPASIMREFNKTPLRKKGRVIETMMDFFDEKGLQNLRNMYFNDILERSSKGGYSGTKLRNLINSQPKTVIDKVFTSEMKSDIADLMGDLLADEVARKLGPQLKNFGNSKKNELIKILNRDPSSQVWMATRGFTKFGLRALSTIATLGIARDLLERRAVRSAQSYLRGTGDELTLSGLTFSALKAPAFIPLDKGRAARVAPTVTQRTAREEVLGDDTKEAKDGMDSELENLLKGL